MNSVSASSSSRPPTSELLRWIGRERVGVHLDLVLAHEAPEARDLRDAGNCLELVAEIPVLDRAQIRQVVAAAVVDERVLVDPADAGGVRAQRGGHAWRKPPPHEVQVLEHAAAGPVQVGTVLEDDVDEGEPEERVTADGLGERH
jgi:hypothetical protein